ncbi:DUF4334 domain-containing protein [Shimia thalassica]|uniref:DUF4334 domain-containing protein n=2 Tax=Shimia thalassica TaxID=1715693 RepID=UPI00273681FD|nr:DUF4334 domain-containing protein [Shimia thalassica]MDP2582263.1 DUF4334 domain-containing protein [Shimia thalassica]
MSTPNQKMTTQEALDFFDSLEVVPAEMMIGHWRGEGVDTDHPMDGLLEASSWHGKVFEDADNVFPLVHRSLFGRKFFVNPALLPLGLTTALPFRSILIPVLFPLMQPFLRTRRSAARLRMTEYRGKLTATMQYDAKAINDVFRKIDDNSVFGLMDRKGAAKPYFFKLMREG